MLGHATGAVLLGIDAHLVRVEADLGGGLPSIAAVGLPDTAVREGIDRLRAALPHAGFALPQRRLILNLAPAEIRKHGEPQSCSPALFCNGAGLFVHVGVH